ncbi:MAG: hypothetical protein IKE16_01785 [Solobacterium sp.]|nr:hypothetical protein [Solobacterium sp.]
MFDNNMEYDDEEIEQVRDALKDYYGTAAFSGFPMAVMDVVKVEQMDDEEVIRKAREARIL